MAKIKIHFVKMKKPNNILLNDKNKNSFGKNEKNKQHFIKMKKNKKNSKMTKMKIHFVLK